MNGDFVSSTSYTYDLGEAVLDMCFPSFDLIQVSNPTNNAWTGSIMASIDGGSIFNYLECTNCAGATSTEKIVVDGDSNGGTQASTQCMGGISCDLVLLAPLPTSVPTNVPTPKIGVYSLFTVHRS